MADLDTDMRPVLVDGITYGVIHGLYLGFSEWVDE